MIPQEVQCSSFRFLMQLINSVWLFDSNTVYKAENFRIIADGIDIDMLVRILTWP